MKRKSLILVLIALFCLFFTGLNRVNATEEKTFEKITDVSQITSGASYLIVYEAGNVCLDGSLTSKLDVAGNTQNVVISNNQITTSSAYSVTITASGDVYHIKAAGGLAMGSESDTNCLLSNSSKTYDSTITFIDGNVDIVGGGAHLRYNAAADQLRFRFYKSATYSAQKAIQLYKEVVAGGDTPNPEPTNEVEKVNKLFTEYYNEGTYVKNTSIHLNTTAVEELANHFHVENHLVRTTYYTPEALWMSQGAEAAGVKYSYYGSAANNAGVTYGVADTALEVPATTNVVLSGEGKESMEAYYTTLADLKSNTAMWVADGNGYSTTDATVLAWFLDFTAPCLYGSVFTSNYFSYAKATVEVANDELVLKLWVTSENWSAIANGVEGSNNVLSTAIISYEKPVPTVITSISDALKAAEGAEVELTGTVYKIKDAYSSQFNNISVHIEDEQGNQILVYRLSGNVVLGDTIKVFGVVGVYSGVNQIAQGATFEMVTPHTCEYSEPTCQAPATCIHCEVAKDDILADHDYEEGVCKVCNGVDPDYEGDVVELVDATLSFSSSSNRTVFTTSQQVWVQNGVTLTNDKASSTSNVADYANPARFYKSSKITVSCANMTKIVFVCNSASYASALKSSIESNANYTVTISGSNVTVTFVNPVSEFVIANLSGGQVRMNSLTVTHQK